MENITVYQIYNAADAISEPVNYRINLLEGLASNEASSFVGAVPNSKPITSRISLKFAKILGVVGVSLLIIYFAPSAVVFARSYISKATDYKLSGNEVNTLSKATETAKVRTLPPFDSTLPLANHLAIPSIGVNTEVEEATYDNYQAALQKGVWRVSNFGEPDIVGAPVILAAHRYGYLSWTNSFRHTSSFYNLPKIKVGDTITISWEQRKYTYGVYKTETGEAISDYSADLILYTCESLSGPERVFVYAKLIS